MDENEKYYITIYKKIMAEEKFIILKREKVVTDADLDLLGDDEAIYYDKTGKEIIVQSMDNECALISDEKYVYGFPMLPDSLKNIYPSLTKKSELIEAYKQDMSSILVFGYVDYVKDKINIMVVNEKMIKKLRDEEDISNIFSFLSTDIDDDIITISLNDIKTIEDMINTNQYDKLKEKFGELQKRIEDMDINNIPDEESKKNEEKPKESAIEKPKTKENLQQSMDKLNNLVGLENIKSEINKLLYYTLYKAKVKDTANLDNPKLGMFFYGNPGTGKTTVARLIGDILYNLDYLSNNKFVEITPKDLIGEYVGQTAVKTSKLLKKYEGGVIFIDEAYVLSSKAQEYAQEALVEILKELEKNTTVFIFAGYKKEMEVFLNSNPGLASRIGYNLEFKDYKAEELYSMFTKKIQDKGLILTDDLKDKVYNLINDAMQNEHFGNGRYIDQIMDKIIEEHAKNTYESNSKETLLTLTMDDINPEINKTLIRTKPTKKIGFY